MTRITVMGAVLVVALVLLGLVVAQSFAKRNDGDREKSSQ
jgi:hypothetical protein